MKKDAKPNFDAEDIKKKIMPIYRIAIIGHKGAGKTSIVNQFVNNTFQQQYEETENDLRKYKKVYDLAQSPSEPNYVMFIIEDIFPTDHPDLIRESDFSKSHLYYGILENRATQQVQKEQKNILDLHKQIYGYIFVYDGTNEEQNFKKISEPIKYISEYCEKTRNFSQLETKKILVASKVDLLSKDKKDRLFKDGKAQSNFEDFINRTGIHQKIACSAKTSMNINLIFEELGKLIQSDQKLQMQDDAWMLGIGEQVMDIAKNKENGGAKEKNTNKQAKSNKNFLGCAGNRKKQAVDEDEDEEEEILQDNDVENLKEYPGMMEDNKQDSGCVVF